MRKRNSFYEKNMDRACDEREIVFYFSALINAVNSIPDYLLDEANVHFRFGISEDSKIRKAFSRAVARSDSAEAKDFFEVWEALKEEFETNDVLKLRHLNIHRHSPDIISGKYFVLGSPDTGKDIVDQYNNYFRRNEGWSQGNVTDTSELLHFSTVGEVYDYDPYLKDTTVEMVKYLKSSGLCWGDISLCTTTLYLRGDTDVQDPICIICFRLINICSQFITFFHANYWIKPV